MISLRIPEVLIIMLFKALEYPCWSYVQRNFPRFRGCHYQLSMHGAAASGHLPLAKTMWSQTVKSGDIVIDATCGNGLDSLELAYLAIESDQSRNGRLVCIDIQDIAIQSTQERLKDAFDAKWSTMSSQISFLHQSHEIFPDNIAENSVSVICYNLGYLPRGNRGDDFHVGRGPITSPKSTITSLTNALKLVKPSGLITIAAYRGHEGGMEEYEAVESFSKSLEPSEWRAYSHSPLNRPLSPVLFSFYKIK